MTTRIDQVVALAAELGAARAEVVRLEAELAALLGGGATKRAPREKPVGKVAPAAGEGGKAAKSERAERAERVLELAKQGLSAAEIGTKLGVPGRVIHMSMWRLRKAGKLPKAEKSR